VGGEIMIAGIIQARMGSTRLPGKVMKFIFGKPVLWHVVSRVSQSIFIDKIIVATTTEPEDDIIEQFCCNEKIPVFRGSKNDVLDRYYQCARQFKADDIVRITADCPLHDSGVIDHVIREYHEGAYDYVTNTFEYTYPDGLDVEIFSFSALENAWKNATLESEREHVTPYIRKNSAIKKKNVTSLTRYPSYRLTLDTPEDYKFITLIFEGLGRSYFSLDDVVAYLEKHPALLMINQHIGLNEGYLKSLIQDAKKTILRTDRLYLRHLIPEDASDRYLQWLNDPDVNKYLETKNASIDELKRYISEKLASHECIFFGIFLKEGDQHIGNVKLEPVDFSKNEATIGILIGDYMWWGKGICTEVINAVVDYAFSEMTLNSLTLGVISENTAAITCYKNAGFITEKTEKLDGVNANGERYKLIMSIHNNRKKSGGQ
jgi:spore coat polysaccharide biosynthesis protein SpsF (cytidylyltransferase family)/RimJ/RimL family protein N-acetyltransferase